MFGISGLALLAVAALSGQPAPSVPQTELAQFCHMYGQGHHLATFFMDDGLRLQGHVNCNKVTFTLSQIMPPIDEEIAVLPATAS
jgi:hypothetical protein